MSANLSRPSGPSYILLDLISKSLFLERLKAFKISLFAGLHRKYNAKIPTVEAPVKAQYIQILGRTTGSSGVSQLKRGKVKRICVLE
jgi:hypothetical protein